MQVSPEKMNMIEKGLTLQVDNGSASTTVTHPGNVMNYTVYPMNKRPLLTNARNHHIISKGHVFWL